MRGARTGDRESYLYLGACVTLLWTEKAGAALTAGLFCSTVESGRASVEIFKMVHG